MWKFNGPEEPTWNQSSESGRCSTVEEGGRAFLKVRKCGKREEPDRTGLTGSLRHIHRTLLTLRIIYYYAYLFALPGAQLVERSPSKATKLGSIPGQGHGPAVGWGDTMFEKNGWIEMLAGVFNTQEHILGTHFTFTLSALPSPQHISMYWKCMWTVAQRFLQIKNDSQCNIHIFRL
jgi:hypothetical protein